MPAGQICNMPSYASKEALAYRNNRRYKENYISKSF